MSTLVLKLTIFKANDLLSRYYQYGNMITHATLVACTYKELISAKYPLKPVVVSLAVVY